MVSVNVIEFAIFKILHKLIFMQKSLFVNHCWHKQNYANCPMWPNLYFYWTFKNNKQFSENTSSAWNKKMLLASYKPNFIENEAA